MIVNALSIDVEDYFHVSAFSEKIDIKDWDNYPVRVLGNTIQILALLDKKNIKATFFMLGWVAKKYPEIVQKIVNEGHELASHGAMHQQITKIDQKAFYKDITDSKKLLEDISGVQIKGYRAPSFSIVKETSWAHTLLEEAGYTYSSSVYPLKHDIYGWPEAQRFLHQVKNKNLFEIPISTTKLFGKLVPAGGGGFFRLYPYSISKLLINKINKKEHQSSVFYFHPWEIDADQPRIENITLKSKIRHYLNLHKTRSRLDKLTDDFEWSTIEDVFNL